MTQQHPITPPPELVQQWVSEFWGYAETGKADASQLFIATRAAQWGADQELEACCEWLGKRRGWEDVSVPLRADRRPKPPSLKEQALLALSKLPPNRDCGVAHDTIRRALEQLPDNE